MKILVLGASGLVGGAVARCGAAAGHEVVGTVGTWAGGAIAGAAVLQRVELTDAAAVGRLVREVRPRLIVNAAAVAEPVQCDADPVRSRKLNVELPARLAELADEAGVRLIHLSTEQAFDGAKPPYAPDDPVHGINLYARQKIESERRVHAATATAVVLRLPLLLGNSPSTRRSVHERLLALWAEGKTARLYVDEIRQPCTADSAARAIVELAGRPELAGTFHWAGATPLSRLDLGVRIRNRFNLDERQAPIEPVERKDDPAALASRQADLSLRLAPLDELLPTKPQNFAAALAELQPPPWWRQG